MSCESEDNALRKNVARRNFYSHEAAFPTQQYRQEGSKLQLVQRFPSGDCFESRLSCLLARDCTAFN